MHHNEQYLETRLRIKSVGQSISRRGHDDPDKRIFNLKTQNTSATDRLVLISTFLDFWPLLCMSHVGQVCDATSREDRCSVSWLTLRVKRRRTGRDIHKSIISRHAYRNETIQKRTALKLCKFHGGFGKSHTNLHLMPLKHVNKRRFRIGGTNALQNMVWMYRCRKEEYIVWKHMKTSFNK